MGGSVFDVKLSFNMLGLPSLLNLAKTASRSIGPLMCSWKFLLSEFVFCLYKSAIRRCIVILIDGMIFQDISGDKENVYDNSFFLRRAIMFYLPRECLSLNYHLKYFKTCS